MHQVRAFAVSCLESLDNDRLRQYLLQASRPIVEP